MPLMPLMPAFPRLARAGLATALVCAIAAGCVALAPPSVPTTPAPLPKPDLAASELPPPAPREFRAAWVATVANIDWPRDRKSVV